MPSSPNHRRGDAVAKALDTRFRRRRKQPRMKGHPKDCLCYDCLFGPEGQIDPDYDSRGGRRG